MWIGVCSMLSERMNVSLVQMYCEWVAYSFLKLAINLIGQSTNRNFLSWLRKLLGVHGCVRVSIKSEYTILTIDLDMYRYWNEWMNATTKLKTATTAKTMMRMKKQRQTTTKRNQTKQKLHPALRCHSFHPMENIHSMICVNYSIGIMCGAIKHDWNKSLVNILRLAIYVIIMCPYTIHHFSALTFFTQHQRCHQ